MAMEADREPSHEPLDSDTVSGPEEVDRRDLSELLLETRDVCLQLGAPLFWHVPATRERLLNGAHFVREGLVVRVPCRVEELLDLLVGESLEEARLAHRGVAAALQDFAVDPGEVLARMIGRWQRR
jgi:hypothetical protein